MCTDIVCGLCVPLRGCWHRGAANACGAGVWLCGRFGLWVVTYNVYGWVGPGECNDGPSCSATVSCIRHKGRFGACAGAAPHMFATGPVYSCSQGQNTPGQVTGNPRCLPELLHPSLSFITIQCEHLLVKIGCPRHVWQECDRSDAWWVCTGGLQYIILGRASGEVTPMRLVGCAGHCSG